MHTEASFPLAAISKVYPDPTGTRLVCVDEKSDAYLHNPVSSSVYTCTFTQNIVHAVHVYMYMFKNMYMYIVHLEVCNAMYSTRVELWLPLQCACCVTMYV